MALPIHKINKRKILAVAILLFGFLVTLSIGDVQAGAQDSSVSFKKDSSTGFFGLTIKDSDGIQEFSFSPIGKLPYGGGLSGCPKTFSIKNATFDDPGDFTPVMPGYVIDCRNNTSELEIPPPEDGLSISKILKKEEPPPPPPPPAIQPEEEQKKGPLTLSDVPYPVLELGNCGSETECRSYCDNAAHAKECFAFAKQYSLISKEEAKETADKFLNVTNGPGGCNSWASCENYCNTIDHIDACIVFAEDTGYYSGDKLAEAKKFQSIIKSGKQFPGGCTDRNTCEIYCADSNHMEECLNFAEETGFMPKEEIEQARKILPLMQRGETPGGCTSKEQCEKYCFAEEHLDECIAFADKAGLLSDEEREMIKKTGGKGPGGCRSKEQCEAYCADNMDACFDWSLQNGFMTENELQKAREGISRFKEELDTMPPEVVGCLKDTMGEQNFNRLANGQPVFDREMEGKMKSCFSQLTSQLSQQLNSLPPEGAQCIKDTIGEEGLNKLQSGEFDGDIDFSSLETCFQQLQASFGGGGPGGPGGFTGPGGCTSIDECTSFCQTNPQECEGFGPPGGGGEHGGFPGSSIPSGESYVGPGGCATPEECIRYCQEESHKDECNAFQTPATTPYAGGAGPGGCGSVEECREYCGAHPSECEGFISEEVPSEVKCQAGFEIKRDNRDFKYCSPLSCPEGQQFITDFYGRQACSPIGDSQQYQQSPATDYQQQYEQQYPQEPPTGSFVPIKNPVALILWPLLQLIQ